MGDSLKNFKMACLRAFTLTDLVYEYKGSFTKGGGANGIRQWRGYGILLDRGL